MKIKEKLVEEVTKLIVLEGEFSCHSLIQHLSLQNIPKIEDEDEGPEELDFENCEIHNVTDKELIIWGGGDWQNPHEVTVTLDEDDNLICGEARIDDDGKEMKETNFLKAINYPDYESVRLWNYGE